LSRSYVVRSAPERDELPISWASVSHEAAAAIVLLAKARIGELTGEMAKDTRHEAGTRTGSSRTEQPTRPTKSAALAAEGLTRKDACECEKIVGGFSGYC
jgi:hypothetical protein